MSRLCEGRVAIVTGAAQGVGRQHALLLAKCGAKVVVNDIGAEIDGTKMADNPAYGVVDEIKAMGGEAVVNGDDVSSWEGSKRMIDQAISEFGKLDVVINNAGILRDRMLTNMSESEWDAVMQVHLKGTFAPSRHAAAHWRELAKQTGKPTTGGSSTPARHRASTATSARPTTAPPRPVSQPSRSSPRANCAATASRSMRSHRRRIPG